MSRLGTFREHRAAWASASNFANSLETRLVCPLKPHAQRLREKYPKM